MAEIQLLCLKYLLFLFNVIFWLAGVLILGLGIWAHIISNQGGIDFSKLRGAEVDSIIVFLFANYPLFIIFIGIIIFVLATSGCIGALRENTCLLNFFAAVLCIIFLLQVALGLFLFITLQYNKESFFGEVESVINISIRKYRDDINLQELIDGLQQGMECCGSEGFDDWEQNLYFNCSMEEIGAVEACGVPFSCCRKNPEDTVINIQCGYGIRKQGMNVERGETIYVQGCSSAIEFFLVEHYYTIGGVPIAFALLEMFGIFFARKIVSIVKDLKARYKYQERQLRRYQQEQEQIEQAMIASRKPHRVYDRTEV
ncbi:tetraspanin-14-like [Glandiceps talaboti]